MTFFGFRRIIFHGLLYKRGKVCYNKMNICIQP